MSCCGGNCGCGANCNCGAGCGGCKMYPDMSSSEGAAATETTIAGVTPVKTHFEGSEVRVGAAEACKCGAECKCSPCTC